MSFSKQENDFFVETSGAKLFARAMGNGSPLMMIHGGPTLSHRYFLPHMLPLTKKNRVIYYDQRGGGQSVCKEPKSRNVDVFIQDIDAVREFLGLEKISVLGHSWGGFLAMHYAIKYPHRLNKLILMNSMGCSSNELALFKKEQSARLESLKDQLHNVEASKEFASGDPKTVAAYNKLIFGTYLYDCSQINKLDFDQTPEANKMGFETFAALRDSFLSLPFDITKDLQRLKCSTLILHGDVDPVPITTAQNLHKIIRHSKLRVFQRCGHFSYLEKPDECFPLIDQFLHEDQNG
jgi:proline iminopeptidase